MPLKTQLCDPHGLVIEQIVFASLTLPAHIPDAAFRPDFSTEGFQWVRDVRAPLMAPAADSAAWNALHLPPGFRMTLRSAQTLPGSTQVVDHLVFTDGVASVSVFVEHRETTIQAAGAAPEPASAPEVTSVGASSAFSTVVDGHKITAVGEVPPETVQFIATQVKAGNASAAVRP
jgi:sigma-E factor negative regulatory protein RseB